MPLPDAGPDRAAELRLHRSEESRQLALEAAGLGTWDYDPLSGTLVWDARSKELFGLAPDTEITYRAFLAGVHPDDRQRINRVARAAIDPAGAGRIVDECRVIGGGAERWIAVRGRASFAAGRCTRFIGIMMDVTQRKRAEAELRRLNETLEQRVAAELAERLKAEASQRQAQKMEAIGQLTGGVAHDFNNLLTSVLGNLELLDTRVTEEKTRRLVRAAMRAAQRGARLTEQLLAFSRRQHLSAAPADLNGAVRGISDMLQRTLGGTITVRPELAEGLWPALVDATQIELAILNLAINARDAMPQGGVLAITTRNVNARDVAADAELRPGDYVEIAVTDTGEGMTETVRAKAVEPFFTTKGIGKGSGLGLSQAYGLARQSQGGMRIVSEPGQGTTVALYLPRALAVDAAPVATDEAAALASRNAAILVVDDQDDVRAVAVEHLRLLGYETVEASGGQAALDVIRSGAAIDLLLVDYAMPDVGGADVVDAVKAARPELSVVLVTGYADLDDLDARLRGVKLLKKPYRLRDLAAALDAALRQQDDAANADALRG